MKRITIGRGNDCDIVIPDERDNVSRHHAVISFNLFGKMTISDTSSNGTFINGKRMLKGVSMPVTVNDEVRLGDGWIFDWKLVEDPYKAARKWLIAAVSVLLLAAVGFGVWQTFGNAGKADNAAPVVLPKDDKNQDDSWNKDSTAKVAPTETSISIGGKAADEKNNAAARKKTTRKTVYKNKERKKPQANNAIHKKSMKAENRSNEKMPVVN